MIRSLIVGFGAGVAAVLLAASLVTGAALALPLFLLAPLPIAIAGLGWGTLASITAIVTGAAITVGSGLSVGTVEPPILALCFVVLVGAPAAWAAYLAGLARPAADAGAEWYPINRILLNILAVTSAGVAVAGVAVEFDPDRLANWLLAAIPESSDFGTGLFGDGSRAEFETSLHVILSVMAAPFAAMILLMTVLAVWLAGRIARASGLLARPWTPLWTVRLPAWVSGVFVVAFVLVFFTGPLGQIAAVIAGTTGYALALVGLAVVHARIVGPARPMLLSGLYVVILIFGLPILIVGLIGIADPFFRFRDRPGGRTA